MLIYKNINRASANIDEELKEFASELVSKANIKTNELLNKSKEQT